MTAYGRPENRPLHNRSNQEARHNPLRLVGGKYIDPTPEKKGQDPNQRARWNRFSSLCWDLRLCELLTEGEFNPALPYNNLIIPVKDLVRYWWNNCVDQEAMLGDILEDILTLCKDRMLPKKEEAVEISLDLGFFDGLTITIYQVPSAVAMS